MIYLSENEVGFDSGGLGFPSIRGCHAIVYVNDNGLFGLHNYGGDLARDWPERSSIFADFVRAHGQGGGAGKALYGVCYATTQRAYGTQAPKTNWTGELTAFAAAVGFGGAIYGYDLAGRGFLPPAYVHVHGVGATCVIQVKPWNKADSGDSWRHADVGFLRRIADTFDPETRAAPIASSLLGSVAYGNRLINGRTAENLATVLACVSAISSAVASLPAFVYRLMETGREEDNAPPLAILIRNGPNDRQSWPDFLEFMIASVLLRGNGLAEIRADRAGKLIALIPIPWDFVSVQMLPSGRLAYDIVEVNGIVGGTGRPRRLLEGEVLHIKDRSDDGLIGRSRLSRAAAVVSNALSIQDFSSALYANGIRPSGVLETDHKLAEPVYEKLRNALETFSGPGKAGKALVLESGLKWKPISITPEDAELLASRRFTGEELARLYNVPPPIIGDLTHGTFTNSETLIRFFAQSTLATWCRKIEAEIHRSVFSDASRATHEFVLDLSGLLRGDPETRWKSHEIALRNQVLSPNEIRGEEGWNPRPGGDQFAQSA